MPDRRQQHDRFRNGDRKQIMRARQAAEALFTSKQDIAEQPVPSAAQEPKSRKPRVLPILVPAPLRQEVADTSGEPGESDHTPDPNKETGIPADPGKIWNVDLASRRALWSADQDNPGDVRKA
ncbi:MAG: hypothetical protein JO007_06655 [Alphaproteobacteria bacterium]|nr:hypothetical protein [Alphaproteobacteria bacterium]